MERCPKGFWRLLESIVTSEGYELFGGTLVHRDKLLRKGMRPECSKTEIVLTGKFLPRETLPSPQHLLAPDWSSTMCLFFLLFPSSSGWLQGCLANSFARARTNQTAPCVTNIILGITLASEQFSISASLSHESYLCVFVSRFISNSKDGKHWIRAHPHPGWPYYNLIIYAKPYFQLSPHSQVPEFRTWTCLREDTVQPTMLSNDGVSAYSCTSHQPPIKIFAQCPRMPYATCLTAQTC